jgi:hypothetical protein
MDSMNVMKSAVAVLPRSPMVAHKTQPVRLVEESSAILDHAKNAEFLVLGGWQLCEGALEP